MQLTSLLLLVGLLQVSAKSFSQQKITLSEYQAPLKKVFKELRKQSGYDFVYSNSVLNKATLVTVNLKDASLKEAIEQCLKGQPLTYAIVDKTVVISIKNGLYSAIFLPDSSLKITGHVTDENNNPLIGVSVSLKGTQTGTITDANGDYSLTLPNDNGTLVFSYVGYTKQELPVNGRTEINVALKASVSSLNQLVVVGYETKEKGQLTGSVATLDDEAVKKHRTTDFVKSLQGTMPGVIVKDVGGPPGREDAQILIRGTHTLGDNTPLYVVDGVPQGSIKDLSPYDIASVSVLKDASAAIYGARAANGVIVIRTKRGRIGKPTLQFNMDYGVNNLTRVPQLMSSTQYAIYRNEINEMEGQLDAFTKDDIEKYRSGSDPLTHPNTDWYDVTFKKSAPVSNHHLSISGGSEIVQYLISGTRHHEGTNYSSDDGKYSKYQFLGNIDVKVHKYLKLGVNLKFRWDETKEPPAGIGGIMHRVWFNYPTEVARFPNGFPGTVHEDGNTTVINSFITGYDRQINKRIGSKFSFDLDLGWLTEGLGLKGYASFDYNIGDQTVFQKPTTTYAYIPATEDYKPHTTLYPGGGHIRLDKTSSLNKQKLYNLRLTYNRRFGKHGIDGFVAYEQTETDYNWMAAGRRDLYSVNKVQLFAGQEDGRTVGGSEQLGGRVDYFGSISYDYDRKYILDFTMRRDGSFNFPKSGRFGNFPSVGVSWNVSRENFMRPITSVLDNLKLRFSFGKMGNDRIPAFEYISKYQLGAQAIFGISPIYNPGFIIGNVPNPNITWEVSNMVNYGFDATLWKKLVLSFDYFYERRRQILIKRSLSVPLFTAISLPFENLGKVNNWGVEGSVSYNNEVGDFSYRVSGNFSFNRNKIIYMDEPKNIPVYQKKQGHPINSILAYQANGLFRSQEELNKYPHITGAVPGTVKYIDVNGDGIISSNDQKRYYNSTTPAIQAGLDATLNYKGIGLYFMFQGQTEATTVLRFNDDGAKPEKYFTERWTEDNKQAKLPRSLSGYSPYNRLSTFNFIDASYIRLKIIEVSYNFPRLNLDSENLYNEFRIYLRARNPLTLDHVKIFDPEVPFQPDANRGSRAKYYPQLITYSVGLSISF